MALLLARGTTGLCRTGFFWRGGRQGEVKRLPPSGYFRRDIAFQAFDDTLDDGEADPQPRRSLGAGKQSWASKRMVESAGTPGPVVLDPEAHLLVKPPSGRIQAQLGRVAAMQSTFHHVVVQTSSSQGPQPHRIRPVVGDVHDGFGSASINSSGFDDDVVMPHWARFRDPTQSLASSSSDSMIWFMRMLLSMSCFEVHGNLIGVQDVGRLAACRRSRSPGRAASQVVGDGVGEGIQLICVQAQFFRLAD